MRRLIAWLSGLALWLALASPAHGQVVVAAPSELAGGVVTLIPEPGFGGDGALFLNPGATGLTRLNSQATVEGRSASSLGNLQFGFDYVRPFWTFRDFILAVPAANAGSFPLLGDIGHVDNHFAFAPRVRYNYEVKDLDFDVSVSGTFLSLIGRLQREINDTNAGVGNLTANSSLTIVTANVPEFSRRMTFPELFKKEGRCAFEALEDLQIELGIGGRYSSIDQNYTGSLTNTAPAGVNLTTRYSSQSFRGVGLTAVANFALPVGANWVLFQNFRGSLLLGNNQKDSTLTVNVAGQQGVASTISQSNTALIPVLEMETGFEWGLELGDRLREGDLPPLFTIRVAFAGQFWGDVGPLSAGSAQAFRSSDLFLLGAQVMVGFHR
jgi:hypothetical protein